MTFAESAPICIERANKWIERNMPKDLSAEPSDTFSMVAMLRNCIHRGMTESPRHVWKPCADGLPEEGQEVLFRTELHEPTTDYFGTYKGVYSEEVFWVDNVKHEKEFGISKQGVVSWIPSPDSYNPDQIVDVNKKTEHMAVPGSKELLDHSETCNEAADLIESMQGKLVEFHRYEIFPTDTIEAIQKSFGVKREEDGYKAEKRLIDACALEKVVSEEYPQNGSWAYCEFMEAIRSAPTIASPITGSTSDGYHTFDELYRHRGILFALICADHMDIAWKTLKHSDGTMYPGMFLCGIDTPYGQATYHMDLNPFWNLIQVKELPAAPEWDGHTPDMALNRIAAMAADRFVPLEHGVVGD